MPHSEHCCTHINQVIDEREGTMVCLDCGYVVAEQIYHETSLLREENNNLSCQIKDILDKLFLPHCFTADIIRNYNKLTKKKHLLEYVIYLTLHEMGYPISIKDIACVTGITDSKIYDLQENDKAICLQPHDLLEKYCNLLQLDYKTYSLIKNDLPTKIETGHNPLTVIASTIYKFSKNNKLKLSMKQIASVVNISTVSIQRYIRKC
jgi:transcription initiation factor TFIIIB Brf1 subunit/transcription initiation factor TFIIB